MTTRRGFLGMLAGLAAGAAAAPLVKLAGADTVPAPAGVRLVPNGLAIHPAYGVAFTRGAGITISEELWEDGKFWREQMRAAEAECAQEIAL